MRNFGCWRHVNETNQGEIQNDNQDESLQLRSLPGSLLQLRLPERQGEKPSGRLRVRRKLQVRANMLL
jgi:hypothetical protein